jgi:polyphosphate kinase 2 (PPK2 family)
VQRAQLQQRLDDPRRRWKFDPADLPPRHRWDDYIDAYAAAISETASDHAPWYVIPADRRWYRKLAVAEIVAQTLRDMDPRYPPPAEGFDEIVIPE